MSKAEADLVAKFRRAYFGVGDQPVPEAEWFGSDEARRARELWEASKFYAEDQARHLESAAAWLSRQSPQVQELFKFVSTDAGRALVERNATRIEAVIAGWREIKQLGRADELRGMGFFGGQDWKSAELALSGPLDPFVKKLRARSGRAEGARKGTASNAKVSPTIAAHCLILDQVRNKIPSRTIGQQVVNMRGQNPFKILAIPLGDSGLTYGEIQLDEYKYLGSAIGGHLSKGATPTDKERKRRVSHKLSDEKRERFWAIARDHIAEAARNRAADSAGHEAYLKAEQATFEGLRRGAAKS